MFQVFMQGFTCRVVTASLLHFWIVPYLMNKREEDRERKSVQEDLFNRAVKSIQKGIIEQWVYNDELTPEIIQSVCDLAVFKFSAEVSMVHEDDEYLIWVKYGTNSKQISGSFTKPPKELAKFKEQEFNKSPIL